MENNRRLVNKRTYASKLWPEKANDESFGLVLHGSKTEEIQQANYCRSTHYGVNCIKILVVYSMSLG